MAKETEVLLLIITDMLLKGLQSFSFKKEEMFQPFVLTRFQEHSSNRIWVHLIVFSTLAGGMKIVWKN